MCLVSCLRAICWMYVCAEEPFVQAELLKDVVPIQIQVPPLSVFMAKQHLICCAELRSAVLGACLVCSCAHL